MSRKIILNVPHASLEGVFDRQNGWINNVPSLQKQVIKWTDWFTDYIFSTYNPSVLTQRSSLSRFIVDVERLIDDPMEKQGQGIIYTEFENIPRFISDKRKAELIAYYHTYRKQLGNLITSDNDILIDCHSFPSELAPHVDICIGYNEDWSKPSDEFLHKVQTIFRRNGLRAAFNTPYSNSITPGSPFKYKSFMLEINKACYMNEKYISLHNGCHRLRRSIRNVFRMIMESQNNQY